jgi:hypothetical protein
MQLLGHKAARGHLYGLPPETIVTVQFLAPRRLHHATLQAPDVMRKPVRLS